MKKFQSVRGMRDILPGDSQLFRALEDILISAASQYGYEELRTPILEDTNLFIKSIGDGTDIVEKEMYTFTDAKKNSFTMRPEGTASCARALIEHGMNDTVNKIWYLGPFFRHERPQKGRYRQFHQVGAEVFGASDAKIDAELISITDSLWKSLGINARLEINSLGSKESRSAYRNILTAFFNENISQLDEDSLRRLKTNPLRILDSKNKDLELLILKTYLDNLDIPYEVNPKLVRGLDYYNQTVFEWISNDLGSQGTICGGGRYDGLVEKMGGSPTPAIGFAMGLERIALLIQDKKSQIVIKRCQLYFVTLGDKAQIESMKLSKKILQALPYITLSNDLSMGSLKSQMKKADKSNADFALILGEEELSNNQLSIKPLKGQGVQQSIKLEGIIQHLQEIL